MVVDSDEGGRNLAIGMHWFLLDGSRRYALAATRAPVERSAQSNLKERMVERLTGAENAYRSY